MHNPFASWQITQTWDEHPAKTKGVDWTAPTFRAPLRAFAACRVVYHPDNGTAGNTAHLYTDEGYTRYLHCADEGFPSGERWLAEGETVALEGSTGDSTGDHVHVDSWRDGQRVPPFFLTAPASGSSPITPFESEEDNMASGIVLLHGDHLPKSDGTGGLFCLYNASAVSPDARWQEFSEYPIARALVDALHGRRKNASEASAVILPGYAWDVWRKRALGA